LFSYLSPEARVPAGHPLRKIREQHIRRCIPWYDVRRGGKMRGARQGFDYRGIVVDDTAELQAAGAACR
jgi:hypothetical protein